MCDDDFVTIVSLDKESVNTLVKYAKMSGTLKDLINDAGCDNPVPVSINGKVLKKVVEYMKHHSDTTDTTEEKTDNISPWDLSFCKVSQPELFELILAANYLDIKALLDLTCKTVANMIKGKTPVEIRKTFNIKNDFSEEEEKQVRKENEWCEQR